MIEKQDMIDAFGLNMLPDDCHCGIDGHALNSVNCPVHGDHARLRKQERRIHRLIDKLTDILAITQETTLGLECWQKIQNIEATAANAIAVDLNILEGDE
jgi:hypothetical protein